MEAIVQLLCLLRILDSGDCFNKEIYMNYHHVIVRSTLLQFSLSCILVFCTLNTIFLSGYNIINNRFLVQQGSFMYIYICPYVRKIYYRFSSCVTYTNKSIFIIIYCGFIRSFHYFVSVSDSDI